MGRHLLPVPMSVINLGISGKASSLAAYAYHVIDKNLPIPIP